jgi:hypothetical protein
MVSFPGFLKKIVVGISKNVIIPNTPKVLSFLRNLLFIILILGKSQKMSLQKSNGNLYVSDGINLSGWDNCVPAFLLEKASINRKDQDHGKYAI